MVPEGFAKFVDGAVSSEIVTVGQLVSIVAAPLNGPRKVEKCNQTLNFCQISDLFLHTSAKKLWN